MTLVWDGASYHRSGEVKTAIAELDIELQLLPGYSPDFMPFEQHAAICKSNLEAF